VRKNSTHDFSLSVSTSIEARPPREAPAGGPALDLRFAGALTFSPEGVLFVGDNHSGSIYAFEVPAETNGAPTTPSSVRNIDAKVAEILGVRAGAVEINDLAVHPVSRDIYISVTRIGSFSSEPGIVRVSARGELGLVDLASLSFQKQALTEFPSDDTAFKVRSSGPTPPFPRDVAKGAVAIRSLAIMDLEFYEGELFVAGVAYDNFRSALRRISYPFDGTQHVAAVEMFHIAHDQYESRAPIRAMSVQEIDGKAQLVAAYTCSPVVLVPLAEIVDGAKISARTIIDLGNGQPLDMIAFERNGQPMLFVTNNSRSPQVIPVEGLHGAKVVTREDLPRGGKFDMHPLMPFGPVGKTMMFEGVPLHMALVGDAHFASITRDAYSGDLNLDVNPASFPNRIHNLLSEADFPPIDSDSDSPAAGG